MYRSKAPPQKQFKCLETAALCLMSQTPQPATFCICSATTITPAHYATNNDRIHLSAWTPHPLHPVHPHTHNPTCLFAWPVTAITRLTTLKATSTTNASVMHTTTATHLSILATTRNCATRRSQPWRPCNVSHPVGVPWQAFLLRPHAICALPQLRVRHVGCVSVCVRT